MRILICEDFEVSNEVLTLALRRCIRDVEVFSTSSAEEAVLCVRDDGPFDLTIIAVNMASDGGLAAVQRMRRMEGRRHWAPHVIMAMSLDAADKHRAIEAGADVFLFRFSAILKTILDTKERVSPQARRKLEVRPTRDKGDGVFALCDVAAGAILPYVGVVRDDKAGGTYAMDVAGGYSVDADPALLEGIGSGWQVAARINEPTSGDANVAIISNPLVTPGVLKRAFAEGRAVVAAFYVLIADVKGGEELCASYGASYERTYAFSEARPTCSSVALAERAVMKVLRKKAMVFVAQMQIRSGPVASGIQTDVSQRGASPLSTPSTFAL
ncbi:hypothetical protein JKP88DRAFT_272915 [Tribonema minus]|uniref:Response regulator n=1 Tax=Tribonema minus TaxID=303371 RepID=A0A835YX02_9STRA|nr:hypothetical protein JKP88DRAFT_272915 [Tribonema minus]